MCDIRKSHAYSLTDGVEDDVADTEAADVPPAVAITCVGASAAMAGRFTLLIGSKIGSLPIPIVIIGHLLCLLTAATDHQYDRQYESTTSATAAATIHTQTGML